MKNQEIFNPELCPIKLIRAERKLKMQIKGLNYASRNADLLKLENTPEKALETKESELQDVQKKLTIIYN